MAKFLSLIMLMLSVVMTHAQSGKTTGGATESTKIGYINRDSVLVNLKDYPTQVKILEAFQKKLTADFEVKSLEFEQKYKEYQENEKKYSDEERKKKFAELQNLDQELSKMRNDANNQIAQKERDLLIPLNEKIMKAIETVAKSRGFSHVTERKYFYFASPSFDITRQVIEEANKL